MSLHKYAYANGDPVQGTDPSGMFSTTEVSVTTGISSKLSALNQFAVYTGKQAAWTGVETALELAIGSIISGVTGISFDYSVHEVGRTFGTNFVSNMATAHLGHAYVLRNALDFTIRTVSDVAIGGEDLMWSLAINLVSLAGSEILAKFGGKIWGHAIAKYGGCFVAGTPVIVALAEEPSDVFNPRQDVSTATQARSVVTRSIETIALGSRVITESPTESLAAEDNCEPEQATWRKVVMVHHRRDGTEIEMELLRPADWLEMAGIQPGCRIDLGFADLETSGYAQVLSVSDCPPIAAGEGRVVIGRFITRSVSNLLRVTLEDGHEFTGTTNHRVWSADAEVWKPLEDFSVGEPLLAFDGPATITSITPVRQPADVFNIEVDFDHVYRILEHGILVHNADYAPVRVADLPWGRIGARQAAKAIEAGQKSIKVASRDDAVEVVWRMFASRGFTNTTGRTGNDVRTILGSKAGTYHWDDLLEAAESVAGHGEDNVHGAMRHVQIHLETGDIVRIFFP